MKYLVRLFLFNMFGLWFTSQLIPTFTLRDGWQVLLLAGLVLSLLMLTVQPILKILFIPINLITFGLLSWSINVVVILLLTILVPEVEISEWTFPGLSWAGIVIPSVKLNYILTLVAVSLMITFFTNLLHKASED